MPTLTQSGALRTLAHKLKLAECPECNVDDSRAFEAILCLGAKIRELRCDAELQASHSPTALNECRHEFEFMELVLSSLRTFIELPRPLEPTEIISAMSALQFLTRRLTTPYGEWDSGQNDLPALEELLVDLT